METLPSYNPEYATVLNSRSSGEKTAAVTPHDFASFAQSRDESYMGANRQFLRVFQALGRKGMPSARVVDLNYDLTTKRTHIGIRVSEFHEVTENLGIIIKRADSIARQQFEAYEEALFMLPEKRQLLNLLVLIHEQRKASD